MVRRALNRRRPRVTARDFSQDLGNFEFENRLGI